MIKLKEVQRGVSQTMSHGNPSHKPGCLAAAHLEVALKCVRPSYALSRCLLATLPTRRRGFAVIRRTPRPPFRFSVVRNPWKGWGGGYGPRCNFLSIRCLTPLVEGLTLGACRGLWLAAKRIIRLDFPKPMRSVELPHCSGPHRIEREQVYVGRHHETLHTGCNYIHCTNLCGLPLWMWIGVTTPTAPTPTASAHLGIHFTGHRCSRD